MTTANTFLEKKFMTFLNKKQINRKNYFQYLKTLVKLFINKK